MAKRYTLEQIYEAALPIFARYGYRRTRVEDIAVELDMVPGTLYRYVKDKRQLYEQTVAFGIARWQAMVKSRVGAARDPREQFVRLCKDSHAYLTRDRDMHRILVNDPAIFPLSPRKMRFPDIDNASLALIRDILKRGIDKGVFKSVDVASTAEFLYAVYVMFIIKTYVKDEGTAAAELYDTGIDLILDGLVQSH